MYLQNFIEKQKCLNLEPKKPILCIFGQDFGKKYCDLKSTPSILPICKISRKKIKMAEFGKKNAWFMYFWAGIWKQYCNIWNKHPRVCLIANFCEEIKMPKFGTKSALLEYFLPKMISSGILGLELKKSYCHVWNEHTWICLIAKYGEMMNMPEFEITSGFFGYFCARILKKYCHICWSQHLWISVIAKFCEGIKMSIFRTINANFGYFWARISKKLLWLL